ncbi:MAG TPA: DMT family transporter [bacterium]|nr:DMT family transporter [bacterium]
MDSMATQEAAGTLALALSVAAAASISLNIGKAVQKMKVEVLKKGKAMLKPPHRRDFLIWLFGMSLTFVAGVLVLVAQNLSDKTSLVTSMSGVGLVGLALFSLFVLKERVGPREWASVLLIGAGTSVISYFNVPSAEKLFYAGPMYWCLGGFAVFAGAALLFTKILNRGRAFLYAAIAGMGLGFMNIFYHIGPIVADGSTMAQFKTAYPWVAFLILGNIGFVMTNLAFFHGTGIVIVPTVNSFLIISPMVFEIFIFGTTLTPMQYAGAGMIVIGVIALTTGGGQSKSASAEPAAPAAPAPSR